MSDENEPPNYIGTHWPFGPITIKKIKELCPVVNTVTFLIIAITLIIIALDCK